MSLIELVADEVETSKFFAPDSSDLIDTLVAQYRAMRAKIERMAEALTSEESQGALHYFAKAAELKDRHLSRCNVEGMFDAKGAVSALDAAYWSKAMSLTDVLDCMPQARRDEWNKAITQHQAPEFSDDTVRATLKGLLSQREQFFAERIDGLFRALSGDHVTNIPQGFGKRMILAGVVNQWGSPDYSRAGVINDLRAVIARFMGRDEPGYDATQPVIRYCQERRGEWVAIDGGALRIRVYNVGTAHLEVHPDMAWRLNQILASLHPKAIPAQFRSKPKKASKEYGLIGRPLPFAVLRSLSTLEQAKELNPNRGHRADTYIAVSGVYRLRAGGSTQAMEEAGRVLERIGGTAAGPLSWAFDYDPREVAQEIVASGCIPDHKSHQFYPTPKRLAQIAVELAEIGESHSCLEPSAGIGGLADLMPKGRTMCVEVSKLHADVLSAKGHHVACADFLAWADDARLYDRIVMNPPFSDGRWLAHTQAALNLLRPGGVLVAILPASAKGKPIGGMDAQWQGPYDNEFPGTSVSVVMGRFVAPVSTGGMQ